jgi:hypothetical protein
MTSRDAVIFRQHNPMAAPKLFISYCWSTPNDEAQVLRLATDLRSAGVDVLMDKWDLQEGDDPELFVRRMTLDPTVRKVLIISSKAYVEQAMGRAPRFGWMSSVVSAELYQQQPADKFLVAVFEKQGDGRPYLPDYYKSHNFIDLSQSQWHAEGFGRLLRWVYDKPLYIKPELGKKPSFLDEDESGMVWTSASYRRAIKAITNGLGITSGPLDEYLEMLFQNLKTQQLPQNTSLAEPKVTDDQVVEAIERFLPIRNEYIEFLITACDYKTSGGNIRKIHRFFGQLSSLLEPAVRLHHGDDTHVDHFKFIVHELFLYTIAILLRFEQFDAVNYLLKEEYSCLNHSELHPQESLRFPVFFQFIASLERRNTRLKLKRLSLRTDLLFQRNQGSGVEFDHLMQADLILFLRAEIEAGPHYSQWWPETLLRVSQYPGAFELFERASSRRYFERVKELLAINSLQDLGRLLRSYGTGKRRLPHWQSHSFDPYILLGFQELSSQP